MTVPNPAISWRAEVRRADLRLPSERRISMIMAATLNGWIDGEKAIMESLIGFSAPAPTER